MFLEVRLKITGIGWAIKDLYREAVRGDIELTVEEVELINESLPRPTDKKPYLYYFNVDIDEVISEGVVFSSEKGSDKADINDFISHYVCDELYSKHGCMCDYIEYDYEAVENEYKSFLIEYMRNQKIDSLLG